MSRLQELLGQPKAMSPTQAIEVPTVPTVAKPTNTTAPTTQDALSVDEKQAQVDSSVEKGNASTSAVKDTSRREKLMSNLFGSKESEETETPTQNTNALVNTAAQYIGTPYVWGGSSPSGFDCSGLVQYAYAQNGISIPRTSQEQFNSGTPIDVSQMQPGDLVFFSGSDGSPSAPGHVAMYAGNGNIIEAPQTGMNVREIPLAQKSTPVGARRYV